MNLRSRFRKFGFEKIDLKDPKKNGLAKAGIALEIGDNPPAKAGGNSWAGIQMRIDF
ncbi:hypothetical protein [Algoriphagus sp.]|uniref:hypothetical protein n=1 Tax=Algoriphagus sp. TaxID=1872435 RepID=UPI00271658C1|nr:hypothetical protein [Algoriphagus sp.]MDO8965222.1 hypothetical protein [Algoriphagus sp.]MDP3199013.1 hypothetical protein [Algoriphagus sp.]